MVTLYAASRSCSPEWAISEGNLIEVCETQGAAESCAREETLDTDKNTYIYAVEVSRPLKGYKTYKEVNSFVPAK